MIKTLRHKGLKLLSETGKVKGIIPQHAKRIIARIDRLEAIESTDDLPYAWRCHALHDDLEGFYAIDVSAQWRIIFRMENSDVYDVDYVQYH